MKPTTLLAALATTLALAATGCTTDADDAADPDVYDVDGKADGAGRYGYFTVTYDAAGAAYVKRANRTKARCHDGAYRARCRVESWDLASLGLDAELEAHARTLLAPGAQVIVRGDFRPSGVGVLNRFDATEMWVALDATAPAGELRYLGADGGCGPEFECDLESATLNTARAGDVFEIGGPAFARLADRLPYLELALRDEGLMASVTAATEAGVLTVDQLYVQLRPVVFDGCALACGGEQCVEAGAEASAACDLAFDTCEAWYGTCGRGADGRCGWQWEPEIDVCAAQ